MRHGRSRDSLFLRQVLTTYEVANETTEDALHQKFRALLRPRMLHALRLSLSGTRRRFHLTKPPLRDPGRMVPALG